MIKRFSKTFTDRMDEYNFETEMILQGKVLSNATWNLLKQIYKTS